MAKKYKIGDFGPIYPQFKNEPVKAIKFLKRVKKGEAIKSLYRKEIGFIDIVWGENDKNNKGYGLKHIIEKHGLDIKKAGFEIESFIPLIVQFGEFNHIKSDAKKKVFESEYFRFVVNTDYKNNPKNWLLTSFYIKKNPYRKKR